MVRRAGPRRCQAPAFRSSAPLRRGSTATVASSCSDAGLRVRRDLIQRVRDPGDPHRARSRWSSGSPVWVVGRPGCCGRLRSGHRCLSTERARIPPWWRRLRGRVDEPRPTLGRDRSKCIAHRLRSHRCGIGICCRRQYRLGCALGCGSSGVVVTGSRLDPHPAQSARMGSVWSIARLPDLRLHPRHHGGDHNRDHPDHHG